jgi:transposase
MILLLHSQEKSNRSIAKDMGCSNSCVDRWISRHKAGESMGRRSGSGKARKLTPLECRDVVLKAKRDPLITAHEIRQELGREDVCLNTILRPMHEDGELKSYWQTKKPYISKINQVKRVNWCKERLTWTSQKWRTVVWTDESPFVLRFNGRRRVWRRHNERYHVKSLKGNFKNDLKMNVWGCFCAHGVGSLHHVRGIMDSKVYQKILDNEFRPSVNRLFEKREYIFQQDNDSKHKSKSTMEYIQDHGLPLMNWPAQSPDLNPIENLWSILDARCKNRKPKTVEMLFEDLEKEWMGLDLQLLENLVDSMPQRLAAVIKAKGLPTHY